MLRYDWLTSVMSGQSESGPVVLPRAAIVEISPSSVFEGMSLNFEVWLNDETVEPTTYSFSVYGTATPSDYGTISFSNGVTYNSANSTITIPIGIAYFTVTIPVVNDSEVEPTESLNIIIDGISSNGTIVDDDYYTGGTGGGDPGDPGDPDNLGNPGKWIVRAPGTNIARKFVYVENQNSYYVIADTAGGSSLIKGGDSLHTWVKIPLSDLSDLSDLIDINLSSIAYSGSTLVICSKNGTIYTSTDGYDWLDQSFNNVVFNYVSWCNNSFIAVGNSGKIYTSSDGITWVSRTSGTTATLYGVAYGNGTYVVCGAGTTSLRYSTDLETWTAVPLSPTSQTLYAITYENSQFIAVGGSGVILTSSNGVSWDLRTSGTTNVLYDVTYGNGKYVAVGNSGTIRSSVDGITWISHTSVYSTTLTCVSYVNNGFIIGGAYGFIQTSTDGITWTLRVPGKHLNGVAYNPVTNTYVAVGMTGVVLRSTDNCVSWYPVNSGIAFDLYGIDYGNGKFIAAGSSGRVIISSDDGQTWTSKIVSSYQYRSVLYNEGLWIICGSSGKIYYSNNDGTTWTSSSNSGTTNQLSCVKFDGSQYVIGGVNGVVRLSDDGITWREPPSFYSVVYSPTIDMYVAVGDNGIVLKGSTHVALHSLQTVTTNNLKDVIWDGQKFIAVGSSGTIIYSNDGINWFYCNGLISPNIDLNFISFNGTYYIAGGTVGSILRSVDGINWEYLTADINGTAYSPDLGMYVAVGEFGFIKTYDRLFTFDEYGSVITDVYEWTVASSPAVHELLSVTWHKSSTEGVFVAVGYNGTLVYSRDGVEWTLVTVPDQGHFYSVLGNVPTKDNTVYVTGDSGKVFEFSTVDFSYVVRNTGSTSDLYCSDRKDNRIYVGGNSASLFYSDDYGVTWSFMSYKSGASLAATDICGFGPALIVTTNTGEIYTTLDNGTVWNLTATKGSANHIRALMWLESLSMYIGVGVGTPVYSTDSGATWNDGIWSNLASANMVDNINGTIYAGCDDGLVMKTSDGINWEPSNGYMVKKPTNLIWDGSRFVMTTGTLGVVLHSEDGLKWDFKPTNVSTELSDIVYAEGVYVVVGKSGVIMTSPDLITWVTRSSGTTLDFTKVAYSNGKFVAIGNNSIGKISTDGGQTWLNMDIPLDVSPRGFYGIEWTRDLFIIMGQYGLVVVSTDGSTWLNINSLPYNNIEDFCKINNILVLVGLNSLILTTPDKIVWKKRYSPLGYVSYNSVAKGSLSIFAMESGTAIIESVDGVSWRKTNDVTHGSVNQTIYAGNRFVSVGENGLIMTNDQ